MNKVPKDRIAKLYRIGNYCINKKIPILPKLIYRFIRTCFAFDLPLSTEIGEGTMFLHNGLGCVVHPKAIIGKNCRIYQNVSIAGRNNRGVPVIGDNVFIGANSCVLGGIKIGNNVTIGAMSLVITDIPDNCTAVGVPAIVITKKDDKKEELQ